MLIVALFHLASTDAYTDASLHMVSVQDAQWVGV